MKVERLDEIVEQALLDPYREVVEPEGPSVVPPALEGTPQPAVSSGLSRDTISEFSTEVFRHPIELVLRPHATVSQIILTRIYQARTQPETMMVIERYGSDLVEKLEEIRRFYRVYVETSAEDLLEKEAVRLVKRFFHENPTENQKNFIRMKRFYEKIRSFQDRAERHWGDVSKLIDTFGIIPETRPLVKDLPDKHLPEVNSLLRRTTLFLLHLKEYARIEDQSIDAVTGNLTVRMVYDPRLNYTLQAALATEDPLLADILKRDSEEKPDVEETESRQDERFIAHNIVIESRSRRLGRSQVFSVPILGSRDWNRSFHYSMEINMGDYQEERSRFDDSFLLVLTREDQERAVQLNQMVGSRGSGIERAGEYHEQMIQILDETANRLVDEDFPGVAKREIFLYHMGPNTFNAMLSQTLRSLHIGDIFYLNDNNQVIRATPELVLKKILIDWWIERFENLDLEEVDSYLTYSRNLELMRTEYISLYELGREIRRKEEPGGSYRTFDGWLRKNRHRIFGLRRYEVFQRFFPDLLFRMQGE